MIQHLPFQLKSLLKRVLKKLENKLQEKLIANYDLDKKILINNESTKHIDQKIITLVNNNNIMAKTAQYVFKAFELREFLLAKRKVHD